eukprot:scaffold2.g7070.t1
MYSLKVSTASPRGDEGAGTSKEASPAPSAPHSPRAAAAAARAAGGTAQASSEQLADDSASLLHFSTGNPRVEHILGRVHLYRHIPAEELHLSAQQQQHKQQQRSGTQQRGQRQEQGEIEVAPPEEPGGQAFPSYAAAAAAGTPAAPTAAAAGQASAASAHLPPERQPQLCILALPPDMGFSELCAFMGAYFRQAGAGGWGGRGRAVQEVRLVRREGGAKSLCLCLLRFGGQAAADGFFRDFNGRPFCLLEPEILCRLVFVKDVEYLASSGAAPGAAAAAAAARAGAEASSDARFHAPTGTTELPTCPVCLERLDEHISGIVTTVCNHRRARGRVHEGIRGWFHNDCLRQWGDTSCPVCRYCQHSSATTSHCSVCSTSADLWICLICGHVGCGRYRGSHAAAHWQASGHGYALELETQRVWDYVNDSYVHRLIQSKTDGKLVEVPSPAPAGPGGAGGAAACAGGRPASRGACPPAPASECGSLGGGEGWWPDPEMEEALVVSKLDALASEYNHLLVTQLESQRHYFEGQLARQAAEGEAVAAAAAVHAAAAEEVASAAHAAAAEAERRRTRAEGRVAELSAAAARAAEERDFLKQLNDQLLANAKDYRARLAAAEEAATTAAAQRDASVAELQEQVRDLMVFIQARDAIEGGGGGKGGGAGGGQGGGGVQASELVGATVLPVPAPPAPVARQGGRGRRGGGRHK